MRYLHTMVRVKDVDESLDFYCNKLGMKEVRRNENEAGRFTLIFLVAPDDEDGAQSQRAPLVELTYNWDPEDYQGGRNFGHLAYEVDDIYAACQHLMDNGVTINRPPRDGRMAFIRSPDGISIEILQKGEHRPPQPHHGPNQTAVAVPESVKRPSLVHAVEFAADPRVEDWNERQREHIRRGHRETDRQGERDEQRPTDADIAETRAAYGLAPIGE